MAGYMMYGGRLIICGDSGEQVGQDMTGGAIYVAGAVQSLGTDAMLTDLDSGEADELAAFLERYEVPFSGSFQKIVNAGKGLRYARTEPRVRVIPFFEASPETGYWNDKVKEDISVKAQLGRYRIRGYGASRPLPHLSRPRVQARPLDDSARPRRRRARRARHGAWRARGRHPDRSLDARDDRPDELRSALQVDEDRPREGLRTFRISATTRARVASPTRFAPLPSGSFSRCWAAGSVGNIHDMQRADGIEIYISQGAKPGLGGQLMAKKVTPEIAKIRGIPAGIDLRSPSRHPDVLGADDLVIKVEEAARGNQLREAGLRQARCRPRQGRHQDRLQGRLRLRVPRRPAGLDRSSRSRGARVRGDTHALSDHGSARTLSPRSRPPVCRLS